MKKILSPLLALFSTCALLQGDIITQWDFNLPITGTGGDANAATGTYDPYIGTGTLTNIGGTVFSFANPPAGGAAATSDPWVTDNSALRLATFPAAGAGNKTAGIEFFTSTVGYENIQINWDQENSNTASKYWRAQYTIDGSTWIDYTVIVANPVATITTAPDWQKALLVDLSSVTGVKDNPNFGFRLVSEFQSTATGSGTAGYVGNAGGSYSTGGTHWMDMVTVSGTPLDTGNADPTITPIPSQTNIVNQSVGPLNFTIGDTETAAANLTLSAQSSNPTLVQNISFGGSGANRTVTLTPELNQSGLAMITVIVTDEGGKTASSSFNVLFRAPEVIAENQAFAANTSKLANIQIAQYGGFNGAVTMSAETSNETLFPVGSIVFGGSGSNRTVTLNPAANVSGSAVVTISATDGSLVATNPIFVTVVPTNTITLWNFNSPTRDFNEATGTLDPLYGSGLAQAVGDVLSSISNTIAGDSFDPDALDSTKWRLGTFAAQGTSNKLGGVEFRLSTVGYQDISFSWNHYNSATASRYWRVQYSTDGVNFTDHLSYSNVVVTTFFVTNTSFAGISGVNNNPNFAVRLVSEFESTAENSPNPSNENYVGVQANGTYGSGGTLWLDMVDFRGAPFTGVNQATLSVARVGNDIKISWPASISGTLRGTTTLSPPDWQNVTEPTVVEGDRNVVTISNPTGTKFYQLLQ